MQGIYMANYVQLTVNVPEKDAEKVRRAICEAGAGRIDKYHHCTFSTKGIGRSLPLENANPTIGTVGKVEEIEEEKIETFCRKEDLPAVLKALKQSHPYEEPAVIIFPIQVLEAAEFPTK